LFEPGPDLVPEMAHAGEGYKVYVTGLTHDKRGYPSLNAAAQKELITRLFEKLRRAADRLVMVESSEIEGADVVVVSYGITSRVALRAVQMARAKGIRVGTLRLICVWPFPEKLIRELAGKVKALVMPELNMGQVVIELERCAGGQCKVIGVPHAGGTVHDPAEILDAIERGAQ
jgi:2-oxoglutarate ferredoxin oxidoreductase subunit alpha